MLRSEFCIPTLKSLGVSQSEKEATYLCGNSLGLMPKATKEAVNKELEAWANLGVLGHEERSDGSDGWMSAVENGNRILADLMGAKESEVALTGTCTSNMNQMLQTFYKPQGKRTKILLEAKAFPSDNYCFQNQVRLRDLGIDETLVLMEPREGEHTLRTEDILREIAALGDSLALVMFSGVQYYTGQYFEIPKITAAAHEVGAVCGWDLAHAVGSVELKMHDWGADFAIGCTYKYLNAGAGNIGLLFVHEKNFSSQRARPAGWWGVPLETRFDMEYEFKANPGALGYCQSNPNWAGAPCLNTSLELFAKAGGMPVLAQKSRELVQYFMDKLEAVPSYGTKFTVITPKDPMQRGAHLTLLFQPGLMEPVFNLLLKNGVVGDKRKPDGLRLAPAPLYNTQEDIDFCVEVIEMALRSL